MGTHNQVYQVYLRRGIYGELSKWREPLIEVEEQGNVTSLFIGTLTTTEETVINKLSKLGLGYAIDRTTKDNGIPSTGGIPPPETPIQVQFKYESDDENRTACLSDQLHQSSTPSELLPVYVQVEKLDICKDDKVLITPKILDNLPDIKLIKPLLKAKTIGEV